MYNRTLILSMLFSAPLMQTGFTEEIALKALTIEISNAKKHGIDVTQEANQFSLVIACLEGNMGKATELFASTKFEPSFISNCACVAAQHNHLDAAKLLLSHIDINAKNESGSTCLTCAALNNEEDFTLYLLENGADANIQDNHGNTALFYAKKISIVQLLIKHNADITITNNNKQTVLHKKVQENNTDIFILKELLNVAKQKAPHLIKSYCNKNFTPLHWACLMNNQPVVIDLLVEHGALIDDLTQLEGLPATPFLLAIPHKRWNNAKKLISYGAQVNQTPENHLNPLILMMLSGDFDEELANHIILSIDINQRETHMRAGKNNNDSYRHTPLTAAIEHSNTLGVQFLLDHGADIEKKYRNASPLELAICMLGISLKDPKKSSEKCGEIIKILLKAQAKRDGEVLDDATLQKLLAEIHTIASKAHVIFEHLIDADDNNSNNNQ